MTETWIAEYRLSIRLEHPGVKCGQCDLGSKYQYWSVLCPSNRADLGLDSIKGFKQTFARLLPGLNKGAISKGEMARQLNISHRSLNRYLPEFEARTTRPHNHEDST